jgi:hypothetical protein
MKVPPNRALEVLLDRLQVSKPQPGKDAVAYRTEYCSVLVKRAGLGRPMASVDPVEAIFQPNLTHAQRAIVAAGLLRLLGQGGAAMFEGVFGDRTISIFDKVLVGPPYRQAGISPSVPRTAKFKALRQAVLDLERNLDQLASRRNGSYRRERDNAMRRS